MENNLMLRKLSRAVLKAPDSLKHIILSEENLMKVIETANNI